MAATDRKKVVWGKGGDFGDWSSDGCSSDLGDAGGQRQRAVAGCRGSHGRAAEEKAATDCGRWRLQIGRRSCGGRGETSVTGVQTGALPISVTQEANDSAQLLAAVDRMEERLKKKPQQMVADGGYTTRDNIEKMAGRGIDFLGSMEKTTSGATAPQRLPPSAFVYQSERNLYLCPEGKWLRSQGRHNNKRKRGMVAYRYEGRFSDCQPCVRKPECCPENQSQGRGLLRWEESATVAAFRGKMGSVEARAHSRRRGPVVEFCHAWIKTKLGLRQFHVRGLEKVGTELLWACLTYNLQQWIRLSKPDTAARSEEH